MGFLLFFYNFYDIMLLYKSNERGRMPNTDRKNTVLADINDFLAEKWVWSGGWPEITDDGVEQLNLIIQNLIQAKYEPKVKSPYRYPFEFNITNLLTQMPYWYNPVLDVAKCGNVERALVGMRHNLNVAHDALSTLLDIRLDKLERIAKGTDCDKFPFKLKKVIEPIVPCDTSKVMPLVSKFLEEYLEDWVTVDDAEYKLFEELCYTLIASKCDINPDGDLPLIFTLVNRTKQLKLSYINVTKYHDVHDKVGFDLILKNLRHNYAIAHQSFDVFMEKWGDRL